MTTSNLNRKEEFNNLAQKNGLSPFDKIILVKDNKNEFLVGISSKKHYDKIPGPCHLEYDQGHEESQSEIFVAPIKNNKIKEGIAFSIVSQDTYDYGPIHQSYSMPANTEVDIFKNHKKIGHCGFHYKYFDKISKELLDGIKEQLPSKKPTSHVQQLLQVTKKRLSIEEFSPQKALDVVIKAHELSENQNTILHENIACSLNL